MVVEEKEIRDVMAQVWGINVKDIPQDVKFNDFSYWDSLGHVNLILGLEKKFKIEVSYETLIGLTSLQRIKDYIVSRIREEIV